MADINNESTQHMRKRLEAEVIEQGGKILITTRGVGGVDLRIERAGRIELELLAYMNERDALLDLDEGING